MRKIYLLMLLLPSIFVFSQGGMDFEDPSITLPGSYGDGTFTYNGVEYTYNHSRDQDDFPINGQGLLLRNASDSYFEMEIPDGVRSEEHTSELQSRPHLVCRLLLEKKNKI